jgi:hypothetical protein
MLSDPDSKIIQRFGILNDTAPKDTPFYGIPYPGTYVIDPKGIVTAKYFEGDYKERDTASEILVRQFGVSSGAAHATTETKHLRVTTSASADVVHPGQHIMLIVDLDLQPKMHVYAPGVEGYIPIDWKMPVSEAFKIAAPAWPPSRKLRLEAIQETVPVYTGKFRLIRDITIGTQAQIKPLLDEKSELKVQGTLRYQACDDRMCYVPANVPLQWIFKVEPLDRERVPAELQRKAER